MKLTITEHGISKKSSQIVEIKQSNGNSYGVLSITLKKKDTTKILFV